LTSFHSRSNPHGGEEIKYLGGILDRKFESYYGIGRSLKNLLEGNFGLE
jgi:hypothetical protein